MQKLCSENLYFIYLNLIKNLSLINVTGFIIVRIAPNKIKVQHMINSHENGVPSSNIEKTTAHAEYVVFKAIAFIGPISLID